MSVVGSGYERGYIFDGIGIGFVLRVYRDLRISG